MGHRGWGGVSGAVTAEGVREILDIGFALNSQLEDSSCTMNKNGATCDWEIKDDARRVKAGAREVTVCCEECEAAVKADPARYA